MPPLGTPWKPPGLGYVAPSGGALIVEPSCFFPGSGTFTAKAAGLYAFRLFGAAGAGNSNQNIGGGGGSYCGKTLRLNAGQTAAVNVAPRQVVNGTGSDVAAAATTVSVLGITLTAGGGTSPGNTSSVGAGGTASGGDINLPGGTGGQGGGATAGGGSYAGTPGASNGGGSGAGDIVVRGGNGGSGNASGMAPGGGGAPGALGGDGFVLVTYEGP